MDLTVEEKFLIIEKNVVTQRNASNSIRQKNCYSLQINLLI